jgi:hypothetical protein
MPCAFQPFEMILHLLQPLVGVALPLRDLSRDPERLAGISSEAVIGSLLISIVPSDVVWGAHYSMHVIGIKRLAMRVTERPLLNRSRHCSDSVTYLRYFCSAD